MRAVVCSTHLWRSHVRVGTHKMAEHLVRRAWRVDWFSVPVTPVHLAGIDRAEVRAKWRQAFRATSDGDVAARGAFTLLPMGGPLGFRSRRVLRAWHRATVPPLSRALTRARRPDLLVVDTPLFAWAFEAVEARRSIYRITDFTPGFPGVTDALLEQEARGVQAADVVMVTVPALARYAEELGARRVHVVPNGVDLAPYRVQHEEPEVLRDVARPRAVYVGSLREWFDLDLLHHAVDRHPAVSFVVAGPAEAIAGRVRRAPNLHLLGPVEHASVPALLQHCDVGLIPFDVARFGRLIEAVDPVKLYEYAAAGLPVIATRWLALEQTGSPALLVDGAGELDAALDRALAARDELGDASRRFAERADWAARLDELLAALDPPPNSGTMSENRPPTSSPPS